MFFVEIPIEQIIQKINSARGGAKNSESGDGDFHRIRIQKLARKNQRRENQQIFNPLFRAESLQNYQKHHRDFSNFFRELISIFRRASTFSLRPRGGARRILSRILRNKLFRLVDGRRCISRLFRNCEPSRVSRRRSCSPHKVIRRGSARDKKNETFLVARGGLEPPILGL